MKEKAIIVGAGTYGQVYSEYLQDKYELLGFIDDNKEIHNTKVNGVVVLGDMNFLFSNIDNSVKIFIPIGNTTVKKKLLAAVRSKGFKTPSFIHSSVNIDPSVKIGKNAVYILQGTIIMPLSVIQNDVMISAGTIISHHSIINEGSFISFGVNLGASINVGTCAYIGIGATLMTGVSKIGAYSLIGAGAVIIKDVPDYAVVVGNPGKIIKYNDE